MEQFIKSNFVGKDGFRWWIGQIAPDKVQRPQTKTKKGWSIRYKVRIMGYHPYNNIELPDEDLPWAQVILPPGHGTGAAGLFKSIKFQQGDVVIGFFLDGDNGQLPMIFGAFGNSRYRVDKGEALPFQTYTGYTSTLKVPTETVLKESNSTGAVEPASPMQVSQSDADKVSETTGTGNRATMSSFNGKVVHLGCGKSQSQESVSNMKVGVQNMVGEVSDLKSKYDPSTKFYKDKVNTLVSDKSSALSGNASGMVSGMTNNLYKKMTPMLSGGLTNMYDSVHATTLAATQSQSAANAAGTAAQASMLGPIGNMNGLLPCLTNKIIGNLGSVVEGILGAVADNVFNYVDCIGDQATGALMNAITGQISDGMQDSLGGINKLMKYMGDFDVEGLLRGDVDSLMGMSPLGDCGTPPPPPSGTDPCTYRIGQGPISGGAPNLSGILKDSNIAKAAADAANLLGGAQDLLGGFGLLSGGIGGGGGSGGGTPCSGAKPEVCEPPKINIFGGGGVGASAIPFFGNIVGGGGKKTGSIIGIKMTNPGNSYVFPPFVEIVDNCKQGFGAVARATIKDGKVNEIYIVSEGQLYPISDDEPPIVTSVTIVNPGYGYKDCATVTDQFGNEYDVKCFKGSLVSVTPINSQDITEMPVLNVISDSGSGAILKANLDVRPEFQGEVKQVIDCVET